MNNILQLKGHFEQKKRNSQPGPPNIRTGQKVPTDHLLELKHDLERVREFWINEKIDINPLVSVYYTDVVAKSHRIKCLLKSKRSPNATIVGAKFRNNQDGTEPKHVITHCIPQSAIIDSINKLDIAISIINCRFGSCISYDDIEKINKKEIPYDNTKLSRTGFVSTVVDAFYVEKFDIEINEEHFTDNAIVTIFNTGISTTDLMRKLDIDFLPVRSIDETTLLLTPDQYLQLKTKAPYLIAMAVSDMAEIDSLSDFPQPINAVSIPKPTNEPIIGVIDTLFDERVYFSEWVEFTNKLDVAIPYDAADYNHGTEVSSIIVDGPSFNPQLDDGCGRFRVRHFGVAKHGPFSSFSVLRLIKEIVVQNRDIKVWNLSLGSTKEINPNFISPEAAVLDQIHYENDVVFVIAGTNKIPITLKRQRMGAPADSINSLVVNSVNAENHPASYSRNGPVLSFFNKPDISYYGGDDNKLIRVCAPFGENFVKGTSFAAPWISRKLAYLIHVIGLPREVAKALIIDSATGWEKKKTPSGIIGYGVVPIKIEDILHSKDDEIKFLLTGISEKYDTYNFNIPVPVSQDKQPYIAKATLCYFPKCARNQGVDYTNTEMDVHFGRIKGTTIVTVNDNQQNEDDGYHPLYEGEARKLYRKWDNVKHIEETLKKRRVAKTIYGNGLWGLSIKTTERLEKQDGVGLKFGIVITLKELNGINRIENFIQQCAFRGWLVNKLDVVNQIEVYNKAEAEVEFDE
jgi:serine protease AprX